MTSSSVVIRVHPCPGVFTFAFCPFPFASRRRRVHRCPEIQSAALLTRIHPETLNEMPEVSNSESRHFSFWQGNQGIARRRTKNLDAPARSRRLTQPEPAPEISSPGAAKGTFRMETNSVLSLLCSVAPLLSAVSEKTQAQNYK